MQRETQEGLVFGAAMDPVLQARLEELDKQLRSRYGMLSGQAAAGVLDLQTSRLAMIDPDRCEYGASVPKIGILLAYFALHPQAATNLSADTRQQLGLMVKNSSNEIASKFSRDLGLKQIQEVLNRLGFYNADEGGGIWVGKHYGEQGERYPDPIGNHSHAITIRQALRYFWLLEMGKLLSPEASQTMREIFESPAILHDEIKFVKGLAGREVGIIRKWGSWEDWLHDVAVVKGPGRHYILAGLTHHPRGDDYLVDLAEGADDLLVRLGTDFEQH